MRNLRTIALDEIGLPSGLPLTATSWDAGSDSIICAFGPSEAQPVIELKRRAAPGFGCEPASDISARFTPITSWDAPCPLPDLICDEVLLLQYFSDTSTACLVLAGGDLVVVREDPFPGQEKIEIVGSVDVGIAAAAWAPDEELLAIVTRADTLILMSRDFEPVTEASMTSDDLKASKHVSVGWGKKETQFHGKRAKALRDPTMPETVDEGKLSSNDDGRVCLSWRGDGAFVAINSIVPGNRRVIRVFTREAVLDSASEPVNGLESALSWRPSGNLIACVQRHEGRIDIVFFERNGLRHGEFSLRLSKEEMDTWGSAISLRWNIDSSVLAISFVDRVQLWTMGNYHYYLKQEIPNLGKTTSDRPLGFQWHSEKPLRCSLTMPTSLLDLEFTFIVSRGSTIQPDDHGAVAVVDGTTLKLTPFRHVAVPPPMAFLEITAEESIVDCSISSTGRYVSILTASGVEVQEWKFSDSGSEELTSSGPKSAAKSRPTTRTSKAFAHSLLNTSSEGIQTRFTQVTFCGDNKIFILAPPQLGFGAVLKTFILEGGQILLFANKSNDISKADTLLTQNLVVDANQSTVWCQSSVATTAFDDIGQQMSALPGSHLQSAIYRVSTADFGFGNGTNGVSEIFQYYQVSMTRRGDLLANKKFLERGCSSFLLTASHLIVTTSQHLLKFIHLAAPEDMEVPGDTPEVDERCRSIERGARLVTVVPSAYSVILQMPRGNLETIYPRVLVLAGIRQHILDENFKAAFLACQTHQVDLNIIHDYRPELFTTKIPLFIDQVRKVSRIDEFLSKLKEEDVSQSLYKDTLKGAVTAANESDGVSGTLNAPQLGFTGKVNRICDAFLAVLKTKSPSHLQNIITAHVSKRPPDLTSALTLIASLRQNNPASADTAVSHLCFLTDSSRLYDTALSLYDLEIALLVAQNSQRDPREYLPFLQSLNALPPLRRDYQIDNHLRNYAKALTSLHALAAHDEIETYTVKHTLYTTAMNLYKYDSEHLTSTTRLYAAHLASTSRPSLAATLYESLNDHASASPLHALAHHWREALTCASLVPLDSDQMHSLATSLATTCADESRDYRAAATIHADYLSDIPGAARLLCKGSYFAEASRILALHATPPEEMGRILDAGLNEKFGEILELLADCKGQLAAQVPRIADLRIKKAEDPLAFFGGDSTLLEGAGTDIPDNISLAATDASTAGGHTLFTRYGSNASKFGGTVASNVSRKTSKTVRREERKRARGKKGSVYEEEYLVGSVGRLIERVNGVQEEVGRLVWGLLRRGLEGRERAGVVDEKMEEAVRLCGDAKEKIWEESEKVTEEVENGKGVGRPSGADGVLWDSQVDMGSQAIAKAPEVKVWKRPELLIL